MNYTVRNILFVSTIISMMVLSSCQDGGDSSPCSSGFDQTSMFGNISDMAINKYTQANASISDMDIKIALFASSPSIATLDDARNAYVEAYKDFVATEPYFFGPAKDNALVQEVNSFPVNAPLLEANIAAGSYNLDAPQNFYSGFPAIDYLLYGTAPTASDIVILFTSGTNAATYRQYLQDASAKIKSDLALVIAEWSTFKSTFDTNTGTADGTSISLILNGLNENYEHTKRDRLGIPSGQLTFGTTNPQSVEAFYSGLSIELLKINLAASEELFKGGNGISLDDNLNEVSAEKNGQALTSVIEQQYAAINTAVNALSGTLTDAVNNTPQLVVDAYVEASAQVVNLKTDMPTQLCVAITYVDNASDSD